MKIFLILLCVNVVTMVLPLTIRVSYQEKITVRLGYLFFSYTFRPKPPEEKPEKKKKPKPGEKSIGEKIGGLYREKGLAGFLRLLGQAAGLAAGTAKNIFAHLVFSRFWLKVNVSGADAADTAVRYGHVCGAVGTATGAILSRARCKDCHILVSPDFQSEKSSVKFEAKAHILLFFLANAAVKALFGLVKLLKSAKSSPPENNEIHNNRCKERVLL